MSSRRLLTESATPHEVGVADEMIRAVKLAWRIAMAWEHGYTAAGGGPCEGDFHPENPYAGDYEYAVQQWAQYRDSRS